VNRRTAVCSLTLFLAGCGYVGDTRPPSLSLPIPVSDLAAVERGDKIIVQFTVPTRTTDDVLMREKPDLVVYIGDTQHPIEAKDLLAYAEIDAKPFYGKDVRVGVKALNDKGHDAGFSNMVGLRVVPALALPANLKAVAVANGVQLTWDSPEKSFTIFRQAPGENSMTKLDTVTSSPYVDKTAEFGKSYRYEVQAMSQAAQSEIAEMKEPFTPRDEFPPATPVALAAVVGTQSVELVWDRSAESDFAGYRIYRDAGSGQFERIGESHDAPGFSDKTVEKGKRYRYAVTAYDKSGNESLLSEPVEAFIP
jgi:fibronectin type 3 domain-containing protein